MAKHSKKRRDSCANGKDDMPAMEKQQRFIDDFNELGDWFMQYEYLIARSCEMPGLPDAEKVDTNRIAGCQSNIWVVFASEGGRLRIRSDCESLIIKGVLAVIENVFNGESLHEIAESEMIFVEKTALREQLTTERASGIERILEMIRAFSRGLAPEGYVQNSPSVTT